MSDSELSEGAPSNEWSGVSLDSVSAELRCVLAGLPRTDVDSDAHPDARFEVGEVLQVGASSSVFLAHDRQLDREVVVRVLTRNQDAEPALERARTLAKFSHPNIRQVLDVGQQGEHSFVVLELASSGTLAQWLQSKPPLLAILTHFARVGRGLLGAHSKALAHGHFSPGKVLLAGPERVCIVDMPHFGQVGQVGQVGHSAYVAPEQRAGAVPDKRSDQYSYCRALYEAVYGELPPADEVVKLPARPRLSHRIRRALVRGLARDPAQRNGTLDELVKAVDSATRIRPGSLVILALALVTVPMIVATLLWGDEEALHPPRCDATWPPSPWVKTPRSALRDQFLASKQPYAQDVSQRIFRSLDGYVDRSRRVWEAACPAQNANAVKECLAWTIAELDVTIDALSHTTPAQLGVAVAVADALPAPERCMETRTQVAHDNSSADEDAVQRIRQQLSRARVAIQMQSPAVATGAAVTALAAARAVEQPGLIAESLFLSASTARLERRWTDAEVLAQEAFEVAAGAGQARLASRIAQELAWLVGVDQSRHEDGERWLAQARAQLGLWGKEPGLQAAIHNVRASLLRARGEFEQAAAAYLEAAELEKSLEFSPAGRHAQYVQNQAETLCEAGACRQGVALLQKTLALEQARLGEHHPALAGLIMALLSACRSVDDFACAGDILVRMAQRVALTVGDQDPSYAHALADLGALAFEQGHYREAAGYQLQALEILEAQDPRSAKVLSDLGNAEFELGRREDARGHFERALAIWARTPELSPAEAVARTSKLLGLAKE